MLEERREVSGAEDPDPLAQYVYHPQYVDSIALRDYDANLDGTSVRHYYERKRYSENGLATFKTAFIESNRCRFSKLTP